MTAKEIAEKAAALGGWHIFAGLVRRYKDDGVVRECPLEALGFSGTHGLDHPLEHCAVMKAADNIYGHDPELRRILLTGVKGSSPIE